jgi:hypothetical protein
MLNCRRVHVLPGRELWQFWKLLKKGVSGGLEMGALSIYGLIIGCPDGV